MKKKILLPIIFSFILLLIIWVFMSPGSVQNIKIGFLGTLAGRFSDLGISSLNGILIALDEYEKELKNDRINVEIIVKNDEGDEEKALESIDEFIKDGIDIIIGPTTSQMAFDVLDYTNKNGILLISPTVSSRNLAGIDDLFIKIPPNNDLAMKLLAETAGGEYRIHDVKIIADENNRVYSEDLISLFSRYFPESGGTITSTEWFESSDNETLQKAGKINDEDEFDAVLIIGSAIDTAFISQILRLQKKDLKLLATGWAMKEELLLNGGMNVNGMIIPANFDFDNKNEKYLDFSSEYIKKFGKNPDFASVSGFETMQILLNAISNSEEKEPIALKKRITTEKRYDGLQGWIVIDENGDTSKETVILEIVEGNFQRIK